MSHQTDDHHRNPDLTPGGLPMPLRAKKPWHAPLIIDATITEETDKAHHSHESLTHPDFEIEIGPS